MLINHCIYPVVLSYYVISSKTLPQQPHWGPAGHNHKKRKGLQQAASNIPHWITEKEAFLDRIMADTGWARASRSLRRVCTRVCTFTLHDNSYLSSLASPSLLPSTNVELTNCLQKSPSCSPTDAAPYLYRRSCPRYIIQGYPIL